MKNYDGRNVALFRLLINEVDTMCFVGRESFGKVNNQCFLCITVSSRALGYQVDRRQHVSEYVKILAVLVRTPERSDMCGRSLRYGLSEYPYQVHKSP
jgi:hypothetical protein